MGRESLLDHSFEGMPTDKSWRHGLWASKTGQRTSCSTSRLVWRGDSDRLSEKFIDSMGKS